MISKQEVPDNWEIKTIDEVCQKSNLGGTPTRSNDDYWGGDIPWISSGAVRGKYTTKNPEETITEKGLDESSTQVWEKGTVLVAMHGVGTIGRSAIAGINTAGNQSICGLTVNPNIIDNEFLYYWLQSIEDALAYKGRGATASRQNLNQGIILDTKVPVPPLEEQERIVQRIEAQIGRIDRVEKSVDQLSGLTREYEDSLLAFLFSGRQDIKSGLVESIPTEGDLPSSWELQTIDEVCSVNGNYIYPENEFPDEEFNYISVSEVSGDSGRIEDTQRLLGKEASTRARRKISTDDVIVSTVRPYLRAFALVPEELDGAIASTAFAVLTVEDGLMPEYLYRYVRSPLFTRQLEAKQKGANYPEVRLSEVKESTIPVPPLEEQRRIVEDINNIDMNRVSKGIDNITNLLDEYRNSVLTQEFRKKADNQAESDYEQKQLSEI